MNQTFGQRFKELRKKHHFTQEDIANKLNITPQAISKWESDHSAPDISILKELASIFNITIDELLGNENNATKVVEKENRKDINDMVIKIKIVSKDGDKVNVNFPMPLVLACLNAGVNIGDMEINKSLKGIDLKEIINLVEKGVIGKLMDIESEDGDIVSVFVE